MEQRKLKRQHNIEIKQSKIAKEREDKAKRIANGGVLNLKSNSRHQPVTDPGGSNPVIVPHPVCL